MQSKREPPKLIIGLAMIQKEPCLTATFCLADHAELFVDCWLQSGCTADPDFIYLSEVICVKWQQGFKQ